MSAGNRVDVFHRRDRGMPKKSAGSFHGSIRMNMKYSLFLLFLLAGNLLASDEVIFSPEPDWVVSTGIPHSEEIPVSKVKNGAHYLHFGRQVRVPPDGAPDYYYRYTTKIINQTGLDDQSQINVGFDPVYEQLTFHKLNVLRNGETINKLESARISYLDQENELEQQLYNGIKTMNLLLEDLRIGDVLDYTYSVKGQNPVFQNYFSDKFTMQWGVPVSSVYLRILWQKKPALVSKVLNADWEVKQRNTDQGTEHIVQLKDTETMDLEDDAPSWVDPYAGVLFSEHSSWQDVADWGRKLFAGIVDAGAGVREIAGKIEHDNPDRDVKIVRALRFVQDEIRYVGIELGVNSHQAVAAETTLKRRYGDCKDKTTLMISLLEAMDITAYPVLVNTDEMGTLSRRIPSMNAFDHVIVAVPHAGSIYWLDPTRQHQAGDLNQVYQPDYELALLLDDNSTALTPMNTRPLASGYDVSEHYYIDDDNPDTVELTVSTQYYGYSAESQTRRLQRKGLDQLKADYLEFYQTYYPSIAQLEVSAMGVDAEDFRFKLKEEYRIRDFWEIEEDSQRKMGWIYSNAVNSVLDIPDKIQRSQDYALDYPWQTKQTVKISLPDKDWDFSDSKFSEVNEFFEYHHEKRYSAQTRTMHLVFSYKNKKNHVPAAEFSNYLAALRRANEHLDFGFYLNRIKQEPADYIAAWIALVAVYLAAIFVALLQWYRAETQNLFTGNMQFFPVSRTKFLYMWIVTWGLFPVYWFYRNWRYEKSTGSNPKMMPSMRGLFFQFWYYPLFKRLSAITKMREIDHGFPGKPAAIGLAIAFLIAAILSGMIDGAGTPLVVVSALLALPLLKMINLINDGDPGAIRHNSRWALRHYLLAVIFLPLFVFDIGSNIGLMPANSVVRGDSLLGHDIKFMQRAGVIQPGDRVEYFYSDALFLIRNDGNGFTDRHAFSYWIDSNDELNVETAEYKDIAEVKVFWSEGFGENTIVEIHRKDRSKMVLYLSAENKKDRLFTTELKARWYRHKQD